MYVVLGASGNTGHVVVEHLLNSGKKVRVLGRNADHLQFLAAKGAEIFVADATDAIERMLGETGIVFDELVDLAANI